MFLTFMLSLNNSRICCLYDFEKKSVVYPNIVEVSINYIWFYLKRDTRGHVDSSFVINNDADA